MLSNILERRMVFYWIGAIRKIMLSFFIYLAIFFAFLFPYFLIRAFHSYEKGSGNDRFLILSCLSFGFIFFTLISALIAK